jgi:hypothetical protein
MPHIGEAEIILLGPEEWNGVKSFALAQDVARSSLTLAFGNDKVLDPDALTGEPIWPTRDIAGGKDARGARLKVLVDGDTAVHGQPRPRRKRGLGPHPMPTTMKSAWSLSPFFSVTLCSSIDVAVVPR